MKNQNHHKDIYKKALTSVIAPHAFWSFEVVDFSKVSDEILIEAVLIYGNAPLRSRLLKLYTENKIQAVWEQKLVIQGERFAQLNQKLATDFFHFKNPSASIQKAYKKYNLYDRFSI